MIEEFPKLEQRFAVCNIQWESVEEGNEEESEEEEEENDDLTTLVAFLEKYKGGDN